MKQFGTTQKVVNATRIATVKFGNKLKTTKTLLDHIYVSNENRFRDAGSVPFSSTDHNLIYVVNKRIKLKFPPEILQYRCYKSLDQEQFIKDIESIDWTFLNNKVFNDNAPTIFEKLVIGLVDKHVPLERKMVKGLKVPWVTSSIINECKERDRLKKLMQSDESYLSSYKKQRNRVTQLICESKKQFFNNKFSQVKSSCDVWNVMNELIHFRNKTKSKIVKLVTEEKVILDEDTAISQKFANEFILQGSVSDVTKCEVDLLEYESLYKQASVPDILRQEITKMCNFPSIE